MTGVLDAALKARPDFDARRVRLPQRNHRTADQIGGRVARRGALDTGHPCARHQPEVLQSAADAAGKAQRMDARVLALGQAGQREDAFMLHGLSPY